ncbi:MAG: BMP family ABC transporter substrate-binding protein [Firmicutes bacterium]|nr:BMP family ABC transporter substrate-binding protein [Bacillota bacterium]
MNKERQRGKGKDRKRLLLSLLAGLLILAGLVVMAGCGESGGEESQEPETFEIAMITEPSGVEDGSFRETTWKSIQDFCEEFETTCQWYAEEEETTDSALKAVEQAREKGAKVIFFAGSLFETTVYAAQQKYEDTYFVLLDGVARDDEHNYEMAANSTGVLFAEEQAGYLAGYAAVSDGYRSLGFLGGVELPSVKRYEIGYIQGIAAAAKDKGLEDIQVKTAYTGSFDASEDAEKWAADRYADGTEVIFACGGSLGSSVMKAAEAAGGKVIGVDTDQSAMSETVITSAKKGINTAVYDILKTYMHNNFKGNSIFNYTIDNDGVSLEMANARFETFSTSDYQTLLNQIKSGEKTIAKETGDKSLNDLAGKLVKVEKVKFKK